MSKRIVKIKQVANKKNKFALHGQKIPKLEITFHSCKNENTWIVKRITCKKHEKWRMK